MITDEQEWSIVYYANERGESPVREFLENLDLKTQARFDWSIEQLRVRTIYAREPLVRHLEGKIWELRRESSTNIYRLLYCFLSGKRILFLHGFQKKTQKTPRREIEIAQQRLNSFIEREGGE
ncbi:MAG: type II toxin-antitoxin system RelE/ParE family toxin [Chloroflexi bacterium]|nr:type II toxin-antitoxin system RelE/ParE family toxin [Chloroflexota bacterium]